MAPSHNLPVTLFASEANVVAVIDNVKVAMTLPATTRTYYLHDSADILAHIVTVAVSLLSRQCRRVEFYFQCFHVLG